MVQLNPNCISVCRNSHENRSTKPTNYCKLWFATRIRNINKKIENMKSYVLTEWVRDKEIRKLLQIKKKSVRFKFSSFSTQSLNHELVYYLWRTVRRLYWSMTMFFLGSVKLCTIFLYDWININNPSQLISKIWLTLILHFASWSSLSFQNKSNLKKIT